MKKWLPWIFVAIFAAWFLSNARTPKPRDGFNLADYGRLPVLLEGRVEPIDTVGRNTLLSMQGKSTVRTGSNTLSSTEWILEAMSRPGMADQRKIFRVQHPDLEGLMGAKQPDLKYYSYNDLTNQLPQLEAQAQTLLTAEKSNPESVKNRTPYQKDLMHLYMSVDLYRQIKNSIQPDDTVEFPKELQAFKEAIGPAMAAAQKEVKDKEPIQRIAPFIRRYQELATMAYPYVVPPQSASESWKTVGASLTESLRDGNISPAITAYADMNAAYQSGNPAGFNTALAQYRAWLQSIGLEKTVSKASLEFLFNRMDPFFFSMVIYVTALILGCIFWFEFYEPFRLSGTAMLALGLVIHTFGLGCRMYLEGRPPVTNLYSSAIFIGWGSVILGLILERVYKGGIGLVCTTIIGFVSLIIAHHLSSLSGDTMQPLRAVLNTNLWLSTHVVTIAIGYSSMFVAGILAIIYILRGVFTRSFTPEMAAPLVRMVYGIVCFATLTSFVGTVLGGIWGDQSWGRFWGWDTKENGALLIVLWNTAILHARWAGMIKERGLMAMAVFGNVVTSFSWFGVNMLGVGLHSYGFMDAAFPWLVAFIVSQLVIIGFALTPKEKWASPIFKQAPKPDAAPSAGRVRGKTA